MWFTMPVSAGFFLGATIGATIGAAIGAHVSGVTRRRAAAKGRDAPRDDASRDDAPKDDAQGDAHGDARRDDDDAPGDRQRAALETARLRRLLAEIEILAWQRGATPVSPRDTPPTFAVASVLGLSPERVALDFARAMPPATPSRAKFYPRPRAWPASDTKAGRGADPGDGADPGEPPRERR